MLRENVMSFALRSGHLVPQQRRLLRQALAGALLVLATLAGSAGAHADEVTVYAASSLTDALQAVATAYQKQTDDTIRFSFASSSVLARQVAAGAPAAIYASANVKWMDYVEDKGAINADSRHAFVANQLALIAPQDSAIDQVDIQPGFDLAALLAGGKLAMANPEHVPAGIYGKQSLQSLGVWDAVKGQLVRGSN